MRADISDAIRIADKHLAGASIEKRKALAIEIQEAIGRQAEIVAFNAIERVLRCKSMTRAVITASGETR